MNMEIEKLKYLHLDGNAKTVPAIENSGTHAVPLLEDRLEKGKSQEN